MMVLQEDVGTQTEETSEPVTKTKIIIVKSDKDGTNNLNNTLEVDIKCNKCSQDFNRIALFIAHMKGNCVNGPEEKEPASLPQKKRILIIKRQKPPATPPQQEPKRKKPLKQQILSSDENENEEEEEVQIIEQVEKRNVRNKWNKVSLACPHCNQDGFKSQKELESHFNENWKIMNCVDSGCDFQCTYICEMRLHSRLHRRIKVANTYKLKRQLKTQVQENINGLNPSTSSIILPTASTTTTTFPMSIPFGLPLLQMPLQMPLQIPAPVSLPQPVITTSGESGEAAMTVDEITEKVAMEFFNLLFCTPDSLNPVDGQSSGQSIYYSCKECNKTYAKDTELGLHLTKSDNPCPFPGCDCFYDLPCSLDLHLSLHEPIPVLSCPHQESGVCDKSFITLPALLHHQVSQHGENIDLTQIDQLLSSTALTDSEKNRRREITKTKIYSCPICPEEIQSTPFRHLITLENHKKKEHAENNNDESSSSKNTENVVTIEDGDDEQSQNNEKDKTDKNKNKTKEKDKKCREKVYSCPVDGCENKFSMIRYIKVHAKTHKNIESTTIDQMTLCPICGRSFKSKCLTTHMQTHEENRVLFECQADGCQKSFTNQRSLDTHSYEHTGESPFLCNFCGAAFKSKGRLKSHELSHAEKKFKCTFPDCEYKTADRHMLKKHNQKHSNQKTHICLECGMGFNFSSTLYRHKFIHLKDKKPSRRSTNQHSAPAYPNPQEFQDQDDDYYDEEEEEESD